jgi:hypothetical protein
MAGINHKILRLGFTIARKRKARQDHNKNEDAFEEGGTLV